MDRHAKLSRLAGNGWTIDLTGNKRRKVMKKKKRYSGNFMCDCDQITEQEFVDKEFKSLRSTIKALEERLEEKIGILNVLNTTEHKFIDPRRSAYYPEDKLWLEPEEGRKHLRKKGYIYVQTFEQHGELWVKEAAK